MVDHHSTVPSLLLKAGPISSPWPWTGLRLL